jgi:hypothetical protein
MSETNLPLPEKFVELVEDGIGTVRDLLDEGDGEFAPLAVVGDTATNTVYPLQEDARRADEPIPEFVRRAAGKVDADFVFMLMYMPRDPAHATETVGFVLETYNGTWTSRVPVELSNGRKTVGEVRMHMMPGAKASVGLLPQPRGSALH